MTTLSEQIGARIGNAMALWTERDLLQKLARVTGLTDSALVSRAQEMCPRRTPHEARRCRWCMGYISGAVDLMRGK